MQKMTHEKEREQDLKKSAAVYGQMARQNPYQWMAGLMQRQVGMVEQEHPLLRGEEMHPDEPCAQCCQRHDREARYGLPFVAIHGVNVGTHDGWLRRIDSRVNTLRCSPDLGVCIHAGRDWPLTGARQEADETPPWIEGLALS